MVFTIFSHLVAFSALSSLVGAVGASQNVTGNPNSVCYSYGVDFVDDGHYFINTESNDTFTCISTFEGCNQDKAEVLFVDPAGDETFCSQIPTLPDDTSQLSTCPVLKSSMTSGHYMILILGNNGNGQPYAWQRDLYLDCGKQVTTTITPTVTFNITSTPIFSVTSTSTLLITFTIQPNTTYTVPSATASKTRTITPSAVSTTVTSTVTHKGYTWTRQLSLTTQTVTASCTTLSSIKQDKPCTYSPTLVHPAALETPTASSKPLRFTRKSDRAVDVAYARARIEAARRRRNIKSQATLPAAKVGYDSATITRTASPPVNTTAIYTAAPSTISELTVVTRTTTTTLPPTTIRSGVFTYEVTLPTPTQTKVQVTYTTSVETKAFKATFTRTTTLMGGASCGADVGGGGSEWGWNRPSPSPQNNPPSSNSGNNNNSPWNKNNQWSNDATSTASPQPNSNP